MHPSWELWKAEASETISILKERHPDLVIHRIIEAVSDPSTAQLMTLRIEGKLCERLAPGRGAIYLPLKRIGEALDEARRARRPEANAARPTEGAGAEVAPKAAVEAEVELDGGTRDSAEVGAGGATTSGAAGGKEGGEEGGEEGAEEGAEEGGTQYIE